MCGILGAVNIENNAIFDKALKTLSHRGPDNHSIYRYKNCLLGHTRLAIIDLDSRSNQPLELDNFIITFNGEIYNYIELRQELINAGYKFFTESDTEVIVRSFQHWGVNCVKKFNGMWAFAILDKENDFIFLSRDRFGVKPLYYIIDNKKFVFSSEIKALLPFLDKIIADKKEIIRFLIYGAQEHREKTMFHDIIRFPKATNIIYSLKTNRIIYKKKYYLLSACKKKLEEKEAEKKLKKLIIDSVKLRLRSDVKIGMALSGGIDSNIIASITHQINPNIESFSSIYIENEKLNESEYIKKTVNKLNLKHHYKVPTIDQLLKDIKNIIYAQDEPFDTLSVYAQYKVFEKMKNSKIKVSLDGQGADEIFAGYPTYRAIIMRKHFFKISFWKDYLKKNKNNFIQDVKLMIFSFFPSILERLFFIKRAKILFLKKTKYIPSLKRSLNTFSDLNTKLKTDIEEHLSVLLRYVDRNSMSMSIESRAPFLDFRVVQFGLCLPCEFKWKNGFGKYILRKTFEKEIEREIIWNIDKKGFPVPQEEWLNNKQFINKIKPYLISSKILRELGVNLNINKSNPLFWKIVNIAIWEKVFKIEGVK